VLAKPLQDGMPRLTRCPRPARNQQRNGRR
jgi:hypothetical protein